MSTYITFLRHINEVANNITYMSAYEIQGPVLLEILKSLRHLSEFGVGVRRGK